MDLSMRQKKGPLSPWGRSRKKRFRAGGSLDSRIGAREGGAAARLSIYKNKKERLRYRVLAGERGIARHFGDDVRRWKGRKKSLEKMTSSYYTKNFRSRGKGRLGSPRDRGRKGDEEEGSSLPQSTASFATRRGPSKCILFPWEGEGGRSPLA